MSIYGKSRRRPVLVLHVLAAAIIVSTPIWYWHLSNEDSLPWRSRLPNAFSAAPAPAPSPEPVRFPSDYDRSSDQETCDRMFGPGYFKHIQDHQHPYCKSSSSSSYVHCFSAPGMTMWSRERGDPICIAKGVSFDPAGEKHFKAHCDARDFAAEFASLSSPAGDDAEPKPELEPSDPSTDIKDVPNLADLGVYWGGSGAGGEFQANWDFSTSVPGCDKNTNSDGGWLYVIRREDTPNVWHKLMGLWQAMITLDAMQVTKNPTTGKPWMTKKDVESMRIVYDDNLGTDPLDDWWKTLNGQEPEKVSSLSAGCYPNVLIPLAGSSSPFWAALSDNVYHEPCQEQFMINAFRTRVFRHLGISPRGAEPNVDPVITLVNRTHNRKLYDADNLMAKVRERHPSSKVNVVDFAQLNLREQVQLAVDTDIFIGHHGAGMMHLFFLPPDAAVVEITSKSVRKFRSITRMRGIAHFEADCLEAPDYEHAVHGTPLPAGWQAGADDEHWQSREYAYLIEEDFLGWVDAAVRNQRNRRYR
ncbi:hypothetical protein RB595_008972 [Gaeumannomyces hyphopodioides]